MFDTEPTPHLPPATPIAPEDSDLLRHYAETGAEEAFAELVRRRIGLVYSVALRQTHGDRHRAEDATQAVFTDLARKARTLAQRPVLAGWLYRSAQFAAAGLVRAEQRRQAREQEAHTMETILAADVPPPDWEKARPVLDHALSELPESDRDAVLLRFFDQRPFAEIAARMRLTENTARMRVERALDKLNAALASRGITSSAAALTAALASHSTVAAPAGLAAAVTGAALAHTATTAGGIIAVVGVTKLQLAVIAVAGAAGAAVLVTQTQTNAALRHEVATLQVIPQNIAALRADNERLASLVAEIELLRRDDSELRQLAQNIAEVQKASAQAARVARQQAAEREAQSEIDRLNREGNALVNDYKTLAAKSKDGSLTAEQRADADGEAKRKLAEIQAKQREVQAFIASIRASLPDFQSAGQSRLRERTPAEEAQYRRARREEIGGFTFVPGTVGAVPTDAPGHSLDLPRADPMTLLSAYETIAGVKIIRDPALTSVRGTADVKTAILPRDEALQTLRGALRDQLNIVLEPGTDGSLVAKPGPAR